MSNVSEFFPHSEHCTATIHQPSGPHFDSDCYQEPLHIGYCPLDADQADNTLELWIQQAGARVCITAHFLPDLIKQLKRAQRMAVDGKPS